MGHADTVFCQITLNGGYGESYSGETFAISLSRTGVDIITIRRAAQDPVWVEITPEKVMFHDARNLWGKDMSEKAGFGLL